MGRVWWFGFARGLSMVGDAAWALAVIWLIMDDGGPGISGTYLAVCAAVTSLLMVPASRLVGRLGTWRAMVCSDALGFLVLLAAWVGVLQGLPRVWVLASTGVVLALLAAVYRPSSSAFLQQIAPEGNLTRAMGVRQLSNAAGGVLGAAAGGVVLAAGGLTWIVVFNAVTFLAAMAIVLCLPRVVAEEPEQEAGSPSVRESLGMVLRHPLRKWLVLRGFALNLAGMALLSVVLVARVQERGWGAGYYGLAEATLAVATIVMGLVVSRWRGPEHVGQAGTWGSLGAVLCVVGACLAISRPATLVLLLLAGVLLVLGSVYSDSLLFGSVDQRSMVALHAVVMALSTIGIPVGQALAGAALELWGGVPVITAAGVLLTGVCLGSLAVAEIRTAQASERTA
ncbi:MFS transporter [Kytococcus schroeteri]|uniref:MFS transporter n=1 Tax=Kytococcus schroeteri TaxID=138300 RepID=UPI0035EEB770